MTNYVKTRLLSLSEIELWELAKKATPGPWEHDDDNLIVWTSHEEAIGGEIAVFKCGLTAADQYPRGLNHPAENIAYIAGASPDKITALLETLEKTREALADLLEQADGVLGSCVVVRDTTDGSRIPTARDNARALLAGFSGDALSEER